MDGKRKRRRRPPQKVLKHLTVTCDFEAVFTWLVGLDDKHAFDVQALTDPPRIVVDISQT